MRRRYIRMAKTTGRSSYVGMFGLAKRGGACRGTADVPRASRVPPMFVGAASHRPRSSRHSGIRCRDGRGSRRRWKTRRQLLHSSPVRERMTSSSSARLRRAGKPIARARARFAAVAQTPQPALLSALVAVPPRRVAVRGRRRAPTGWATAAANAFTCGRRARRRDEHRRRVSRRWLISTSVSAAFGVRPDVRATRRRRVAVDEAVRRSAAPRASEVSSPATNSPPAISSAVSVLGQDIEAPPRCYFRDDARDGSAARAGCTCSPQFAVAVRPIAWNRTRRVSAPARIRREGEVPTSNNTSELF